MKQHPQLVVVRAPDEAAETLLASPPEALLLRWAAWHLSQPAALSLSGAQQLQPPQDFGDCLQDGRILAVLLHTLAPEAMQQPHLQYVLITASSSSDPMWLCCCRRPRKHWVQLSVVMCSSCKHRLHFCIGGKLQSMLPVLPSTQCRTTSLLHVTGQR